MPKETILLVDDEHNIIELARMYLGQDGFGVVAASDGQAALDRIAGEMPDLIVLDLMLPRVDGWEVCRRVRARSDVPIIMLTARDEDIDKIVGLELGADDYMTKPFNPRELVARVGDTPVSLRAKEFELLRTLAENPGRVLSRDQLLSIVWGFDFPGQTRTVDVHVAHLRARLESAGSGVTIETVWGVGYKLIS